MTKRRTTGRSRRPRTSAAKKPAERRTKRVLREVMDELIELVRTVSRNARTMSDDELDYAQQRLEWLADEVWRLASEGIEGIEG